MPVYDIVEFPNVASGEFLAFDVVFFELAHVDAVFTSLDSFGKFINAAIDPVDVQIEKFGARAVTACLPEELVGKGVPYHAFIEIRPVQNPVVRRREAEQAHVYVFAR